MYLDEKQIAGSKKFVGYSQISTAANQKDQQHKFEQRRRVKMKTESAPRRAKWWQMCMLAAFAVANNIIVSYTNYISYYLTDIVGFGVVIAGSFITIFRIWDAVTDLGIGYIVDKTNTKIGKFRPYMIAGTIGVLVSLYALIYLPPLIPEGMTRKVVFIVIYMLFVICFTMQGCGLRAGAQILTDDHKQRATIGMLTGISLTIMYSGVPILVFSRIIPATHGFNIAFFKTLLNYIAPIVLIGMCLAIYAFGNDRQRPKEEVANSKGVDFKTAVTLLARNRNLLMLVLSAGTDKLATVLQSNATVVVIMYAIVCGNSRLSSATNSYTMWPSIIMILLGVGAIGRKFGTKRSMVVSSWGGIAVCTLSILLWIFGNPATLSFPGIDGFSGWTFFTIAFLILWCLMKGFNMVASNSLNPMLADVIDYEEYRSGVYCPGTITALFSLADKIISSLGPAVIAILCALIGFRDTLPTLDTPYSVPLFAIGLLGMYGLSLLGLIINVICLKYYDLTPDRMEQIHEALNQRKDGV